MPVKGYGENQFQEATWASIIPFRVLKTVVPNCAHVTAALRPVGPRRLWRSSGKGNLCPGQRRPGGEAAGKERESGPRLCRQAWAKGMSPTCATASPSFKYRIGAGWAGTQFSLLQPLENAPFPTDPPADSPVPSSRARSEERYSRGVRRREGGTDRDPPPAHSTVPSTSQASSGMPPTCQQARSRPPQAPHAGFQPPCRGRRPPPSLRSKRLCKARNLLQGFVPTAESRA